LTARYRKLQKIVVDNAEGNQQITTCHELP
jgi:hypothetical protein